MPFSVRLHKKAQKFLEKMENRYKEKMKAALMNLRKDPVPVSSYDVVKLEGELHTYRIRIGKYRAIYDVYWKDKSV